MTQVKDLEIINKLTMAPLRTCYSMHSCCLCNKPIKNGEKYYDVSLKVRAHENCVEPRSWLR